MKTNLEMFVTFALLATAGTAAPQEVSTPAPAPAQTATQSPQSPEKPVLKLRLDELDRRSAITFGPKDDKNQDATRSLPELGGNASKSLNNSSLGNSQPPPVFPPSSSDY